MESTAPEKSAAGKMLGTADWIFILANNVRTYEFHRDHILPHEISLEEQRHQRTSTSFPPLAPRRQSAF